MSYLRDQDDLRDHHHDDVLANKEHELTLSTAAIFGIFFGQVVLCGIFFGFGYSLGGHRTSTPPAAENASSAATSGPNFNGFKPAAGQPAGDHTAAVSAPRVSTPQPETAPVSTSTAAPVVSTPLAAESPARAAPAPIIRTAPPAAEAPRPAVAPAAPASGFLVQVAAISVTHPEDATMLQNALRAKGYPVAQHAGPDQFIHLLLGPFSDRAAAETMRQRLLTDGYTAYIK